MTLLLVLSGMFSSALITYSITSLLWVRRTERLLQSLRNSRDMLAEPCGHTTHWSCIKKETDDTPTER